MATQMLRTRKSLEFWVVLVLSIINFSGSLTPVKSSVAIPNCTNVTDSTQTCCLCPDDPMNCETNVTCPDGYQSINDTYNLCWIPSTQTTTTPDDDAEQLTNILCYKCEGNEYFNGTECGDCDQLCLTCAGPGSDNCDLCRYAHQGTCVGECPNNTVEVRIGSGDAVRCDPNDTKGEVDEDEGFPIAIVGGAVGGGVVVVLVVVVVIIVVCRRRKPAPTRTTGAKTSRTAMSKIIEDRSTGDDKKTETRSETGAPSRRRNYENQPDPGDTFGRDIQNHGDNVLRYVQDPTGKQKKAKTEVSKVDDSDTYANASMIRVHQTFKDKSVSQERLQEQLDQEEIAELPRAPSPPQMRAKKRTKIPEEPDDSENYLDMDQAVSPKPTETKSTTRKTDIRKAKAFIPEPEDDPEDYENVGKVTSVNDDGESDQEDYENTGTLKKGDQDKSAGDVNDFDDDAQESYENVEFGAASQGNGGSSDTDKVVGNQGRKLNDGNDSNDDEEDMTGVDVAQEDYENTEVFKANVVTGRETPYENVAYLKKK